MENQVKKILTKEELMQKHYNLSKSLLLAHLEGMTQEERQASLEGFKRASEELLKNN